MTFAFNYLQDPLWLLCATLLAYVGWPVFNALCDLLGATRRLARRRHVRRLNTLHAEHGIVYRVAGQPPSHRAFKANGARLQIRRAEFEAPRCRRCPMKATQRELFSAEKCRPEPLCWYVIVDEVKLNATSSPAAEYWAIRSGMLEQSGRAEVLDICIAGAIVRVGPFEQNDAEFFRDHLIEKGAHPKAVTAKRIKVPSHAAGRTA